MANQISEFDGEEQLSQGNVELFEQ